MQRDFSGSVILRAAGELRRVSGGLAAAAFCGAVLAAVALPAAAASAAPASPAAATVLFARWHEQPGSYATKGGCTAVGLYSGHKFKCVKTSEGAYFVWRLWLYY